MEEEELVRFLLQCARQGYGKTRGEVLQIVTATMKKKGRNLNHSISQGMVVSLSRKVART